MLTFEKDNCFFSVREEKDDFWGRFKNNQWETETLDVIKTFLKKDHDFLDIGACSPSIEILKWIRDIFYTIAPHHCGIHKQKNINCYHYRVRGKSAIIIASFLNKIPTYSLHRKWSKI